MLGSVPRVAIDSLRTPSEKGQAGGATVMVQLNTALIGCVLVGSLLGFPMAAPAQGLAEAYFNDGPSGLLVLTETNTSTLKHRAPRKPRSERHGKAVFSDLNSSDITKRNLAIVTIGMYKEPAAVPALTNMLPREEAVTLKINIVKALRFIATPEAVEALSRIIAEEDSNMVMRALENLRLIGNEPAGSVLIKALDDSRAYVRMATATQLGRLGTAQGIDALLARMDREIDAAALAYLLEALGQAGDRRAVPGLLRTLQSDRRQLDAQIDHGPNALMRKMYAHPGPVVRAHAAYALGQIGDRSALPGLINALTSQQQSLETMAAFALKKINDPEGLEALQSP